MDSEAEATIARRYYQFQNRKYPMIRPKIIPPVKKDFKKPPVVSNPIIKVKDYVLKQWAKESFDSSLRSRISRECFLKYVKYFNEYHSSDSDSDSSSDYSSDYSSDGSYYEGIINDDINEYVFY